MQTSAWLASPAPQLYGGAIALLADLALGASIQTTGSAMIVPGGIGQLLRAEAPAPEE